MAAGAEVMQSFELVEEILLRASTYEILVATSVCQSWRAVVENSKALRTYLVTVPVRKPISHRQPGLIARYKLNDCATSPWHFMVKPTNGGFLFALRIPSEDLEVFLPAPIKKDTHLKVLDDAYDMHAVTTDFNPNLEFRLKNGEKVCRTKSSGTKSTQIRYRGGFSRIPSPNAKKDGAMSGDVLRRYLAAFYSEEFSPGVKMTS